MSEEATAYAAYELPRTLGEVRKATGKIDATIERLIGNRAKLDAELAEAVAQRERLEVQRRKLLGFPEPIAE